MKTAHTIITHLEPGVVSGFLSFLQALSPDTRILCAYGGKKENFDGIAWPDKFFLEDESLRGPIRHQSFNEILIKAHSATTGTGTDYFYFSEYDHFPLRRYYLRELCGLMASTQCDLLGHSLFQANYSNWVHYLRYRDDAEFRQFLSGITHRGTSEPLYGMLGNGFIMTNRALEGFCGILKHLKVYTEIYLPTVLFHLGFKLGNINALSDLYAAVRYEPAYSFEDVIQLVRDGKNFCHPVKCIDRYPDIYSAVLKNADALPVISE